MEIFQQLKINFQLFINKKLIESKGRKAKRKFFFGGGNKSHKKRVSGHWFCLSVLKKVNEIDSYPHRAIKIHLFDSIYENTSIG